MSLNSTALKKIYGKYVGGILKNDHKYLAFSAGPNNLFVCKGEV